MKLLVFGFGYSAHYVAERLRGTGAEISATVRTPAKAELLMQNGIRARVFSPDQCDHAIAQDIAESEAILVSIPPQLSGDPVLAAFAETIAATPKLRWIGYLSTRRRLWRPRWRLGRRSDAGRTERRPLAVRAEAEQAWLAFGAGHGKAVQIFRLAGIYGPGRNQLGQLRGGTARRIVKPGQVFNRIHVADIAAVIEASLEASACRRHLQRQLTTSRRRRRTSSAFAASLCGVPPPPEIAV